jgi:hypothetical protein
MEWDSDVSVKAGETAFQWARRTGQYVTMKICYCCVGIEANGEGCHGDDCDTCKEGGLYEQAYASNPNMTVTLGAFTGEEGCTHDLSAPGEDEEHAEDCERFGLTQWPCGLCGNPMHGDRAAAVAFPRFIPSPFIAATKANRWKSNLLTFVSEPKEESK